VYVYDEYVNDIDDIGVKVYVYDEYVHVLDDDEGTIVYIYDDEYVHDINDDFGVKVYEYDEYVHGIDDDIDPNV
jgi:hypothetical protein